MDACLYYPGSLITDPVGNLFLINQGLVKKISTAGIITVVAGMTTLSPPTNEGDGGPATSALLAPPSGLALDPAGTPVHRHH